MRRVPWLALAALAWWGGVACAAHLGSLLEAGPGCLFKRLTGVPCATCGLTRCVLAMGRGDWRTAFQVHAAAALISLALPLLALWDLRRAVRDKPYPPLPEHPWARALAWALLLGVWGLQVARGV